MISKRIEGDIENYHSSAEGTSDDNFRYHTNHEFAKIALATDFKILNAFKK